MVPRSAGMAVAGPGPLLGIPASHLAAVPQLGTSLAAVLHQEDHQRTNCLEVDTVIQASGSPFSYREARLRQRGQMKRCPRRAGPNLACNGTGTHAVRSRFYQSPDYIQTIRIRENSKQRRGVF